MSFSLVGTQWNLSGFVTALEKVDTSWADSVCLHHTGSPDLSMRRGGLIVQHIRNIRDYYKDKGWSSGPHLFLDDIDINGMSPLSARGVHAKSFNAKSIGIEVLGNYDVEDPRSGRGLKCWNLAAQTTAAILKRLNKEPNESTILFHRDDFKTSKSCPGDKVNKRWFIKMVEDAMAGLPKDEQKEPEDSDELKAIRWQIDSILRENKAMDPERYEELEKRLSFIEWRSRKITKNQK